MNDKYKDKIDWSNLSGIMPICFFEKYLKTNKRNKINWSNLSGNENIPKYRAASFFSGAAFSLTFYKDSATTD